MNKFAFALVLFLVPTIYTQQPNSSRQERQPLTRAEPERMAKAQKLLTQARAALSQGIKFDSLTLLRFVLSAISRPAMAFMPPGTSQLRGRLALDLAKAQADAKLPGPQEREKLILFEDYRVIDAILLPHKITAWINGKLVEEILFSKFKVTQPIKAEKFTEKQ